jgi:hypothetical protein
MLTGKGNAKQQLISYPTSTNQQSADQGLMIRSSVLLYVKFTLVAL